MPTQTSRFLALSLRRWPRCDKPHRIKHLEAALANITARTDVWCASAGEILDAFTAARQTSAPK